MTETLSGDFVWAIGFAQIVIASVAATAWLSLWALRRAMLSAGLWYSLIKFHAKRSTEASDQ
ncbi:MAG: hypothetical protein AAFU68_02945 [Pseudomonadota bacterium]